MVAFCFVCGDVFRRGTLRCGTEACGVCGSCFCCCLLLLVCFICLASTTCAVEEPATERGDVEHNSFFRRFLALRVASWHDQSYVPCYLVCCGSPNLGHSRGRTASRGAPVSSVWLIGLQVIHPLGRMPLAGENGLSGVGQLPYNLVVLQLCGQTKGKLQ